MLHSPRTYKNPETFDQSRFLGPSPEPDPRAAFGFGRRVCSGRLFAEIVMSSACAKVLAALYIFKARDEDGRQVALFMD
jgi:cytochrome P450